MDWFDYFWLAQEWVEKDGEAQKRSAISRAYYAMYCTARDKLDEVGRFNPSQCDSKHVYVWNLYREDSEHAEREYIGKLGNRLRRARIKADYFGFIDNFPDVVDVAMEDAQELKDALESLVL